MYLKIAKYGIITILLAASVGSWWYAVSLYREHEFDIVLELERIVREIALPYHVALMLLREPVEELPVPVYGVLLEDVADSWGAARAEGRTHEGTDIFAGRGTPVFSATDGYVSGLNFGSRGGTNVMVIGPAGIQYYYAHFERLARGIAYGAHVTPDTVLGFVGTSGNASGTPPHLHFGIYPERWDAINPYSFLTERWEESAED